MSILLCSWTIPWLIISTLLIVNTPLSHKSLSGFLSCAPSCPPVLSSLHSPLNIGCSPLPCTCLRWRSGVFQQDITSRRCPAQDWLQSHSPHCSMTMTRGHPEATTLSLPAYLSSNSVLSACCLTLSLPHFVSTLPHYFQLYCKAQQQSSTKLI